MDDNTPTPEELEAETVEAPKAKKKLPAPAGNPRREAARARALEKMKAAGR